MVKGVKMVGSRQIQRQRNKPKIAHLSSKHWFFRFSLSLLLILSAIFVWQKLANATYFPVKKIQITGDLTYVKQGHLQQVVLPFLESGFLRLDSRGLKDRLLQVPWIASVAIHRFWPGTLAIDFTAKKPVAFMDHRGLLDEQGNVFNPAQIDISLLNLPTFKGPLGKQKYLLQTYKAMSLVLTDLALEIKTLKLVDQQFWYVRLSNGLSLYLSYSEPYQQLQRFVAVYPNVIASKVSMIDYVDFRYINGMAIRFKRLDFF